MHKDKEQNSNKLKNLNWLLYIAISLLVITTSVYFFNFNYGFSSDRNDWGTFGDFMGGTLNPLFAFLSLFAIIYTIRIQTQELEYSREELKATKEELEKSRIAQEEQSKSFKIQNYSMKQQTFENTFFQLINTFIDIRNNITIKSSYNKPNRFTFNNPINNSIENNTHKENKLLKSYEAIKNYLLILKSSLPKGYDYFNQKYEGYTGTYFGQIYQILKFIKASDIKNKQDYVNLFRAQFTKEELEFLFYHCLGSVGSRKFKPLVEEFQYFEHISPNKDIYTYINLYESNAFGENKIILSYLSEQVEQQDEAGIK